MVKHWDRVKDGPLTELGLRKKLEEQGFRLSRYTYPPGTHFGLHSHTTDKVDAVLSGTFRIMLNGQSVTLTAGDYVRVPAGAMHDAEVVGDQPVVSLDGVKA